MKLLIKSMTRFSTTFLWALILILSIVSPISYFLYLKMYTIVIIPRTLTQIVDYGQGNVSYMYSTRDIFNTIIEIRNRNCLDIAKTPNGQNNSSYCRNIRICNLNPSTARGLPAGCHHRFPRAIIIGVYKAGTRELLDFLAMHPNIVIKRQNGYEVSFFSTRQWNKGFGWYKNIMPTSMEDQITMEKSPSYFSSMEAPARIRAMDPNVKLILIVREPVERAISHLTFSSLHKNFNVESLKNPNILTPAMANQGLIKFSMYDRQFQQYLRYFNRSQIHIVDSLVFKNDPYNVLKEIESFLGLPHVIKKSDFVFNNVKGFFCLRNPRADVFACYGAERGRTNKTTLHWDSIIPKLRRIFKPHNEWFFNLSGRRFEWSY